MKFWSVERKNAAAAAGAVLILIGMAWTSYIALTRLDDTIYSIEHTHIVIEEIDTLWAQYAEVRGGYRGFVITGRASFLDQYNVARSAIPKDLARLRALTNDNSSQQDRLDRLQPLLDQAFDFYRTFVETRQKKGMEAARKLILIDRGLHLTDKIHGLLDAMKTEELQLLDVRIAKKQASLRKTTLAIAAACLLAIALLLTATLTLQNDLSLRRRAEEMRDRYFNNSLDFIGIAGFDGYFKQTNPACKTILGYEVEEFCAKPFIEFVHPDDREATTNEVEKLASGVKTLHFENRYLCKDGSYKWLQWSAVPVVSEGLMYAVAKDISEHKEIEALRNIVPICSYCKRIRKDDGIYEKMEKYIQDRSHMDFSHGICPDCIAKMRA